jgi:hypothetical protein
MSEHQNKAVVITAARQDPAEVAAVEDRVNKALAQHVRGSRPARTVKLSEYELIEAEKEFRELLECAETPGLYMSDTEKSVHYIEQIIAIARQQNA